MYNCELRAMDIRFASAGRIYTGDSSGLSRGLILFVGWQGHAE